MPPQEKRFSPATGMLLLCGSALYLCVNLFASLRVPFLIGGDQAYFWMRAMWMLDGERIYKDFLQFSQPPGLDLLFAALFKVFGLRMWVTNGVVLVLGLAFVWLVFSIARRLMRREAALLAAALLLVPIYGRALNATHHWFAVLAVLLAVRIMLEGTTASRIAIAGAILGVGSFFSLYHGLAGLVAFLIFLSVWRATTTQLQWVGLLREEGTMVGTYVVAMGLLYLHYLATGGTVGELWYFQVTCVRDFAVAAYRGVQEIFPLPVKLHNLPAISDYVVVYLLFVAAIVATVLMCWKRRKDASIAPPILVLLVAVLLFAEVGVSPNWLRIYAVSAPAVILIAWVVDRLPRWRVCVSTVLWVWVTVVGVHQTIAHRSMQRAVIELPAGRVATTQQMANGVRVVAEFVKPDDAVFQAAWPGVYLPLHARNPLSFETAGLSDAPRPGDVELATRQLQERHVLYVLWAERLDWSCASPCSDRLTPMRDYVHVAYVPVATLPDGDTLWHRRP